MFEKKETSHDEIHTLLGRESQFDGRLVFEGMVRIDGRFSGEIFSSGRLVVGESAQIEAKVEVGSLVLNGEMHGDVLARERIEITRTGRLHGSMKTPALVVEEGGSFDGTCEMSKGLSQTEREEGT